MNHLAAISSGRLARTCRLLIASVMLSGLAAMPVKATETVAAGIPASRATTYKTVTVKGMSIFYREA
ncbi:MAG: hypothetical protein ACXU9D_25740, partial [Xanthobacteraceae bacterium]